MKRDRDPRRAEWLEALVRGLADETRAGGAKGRDGEEFSIFLVPILQAALQTSGRDPGRFGGFAFPLSEASRDLMLSYKTIRRHLKASSMAGMIKCVTWYDARLKRRFPLEVVINPELAAVYGQTSLGDARELGKAFARLWLERRNYLGDMQGFGGEDTVPWGRFAETGTSEKLTVSESLPPVETAVVSATVAGIRAAARGGRKTVTAEKAAERKARAEEREAFVTGAAVVWREMRSRAGFGDSPPGWSGDKRTLPQAQKRERVELEKIFERYGGKRASFAWALFCGQKPRRDEKGKVAFLPELAHAQWTTPDKKPSHFAKHIDLVIAHLVKVGWEGDVEMATRLASVFGGTFEAEARHAPELPAYTPARKETSDGDQTAAATPGW